jgi:uncharacterized protein (DUF2164 family)
MPLALTPDDRKQALASLRRFCDHELEVELSDIQLHALLDFALKEIGPSVYNGAITDAQAFLRDRLADLEAPCYEPEFPYWPNGTSVRRK